jgi:hypothetical protein
LEIIEEEEDSYLPKEIIPRKEGIVITVEVTSSKNIKSTGSQNETKLVITDQS